MVVYVFVLLNLQTYVTSPDQDFAAATIQAIGRCASNIDEITDALSQWSRQLALEQKMVSGLNLKLRLFPIKYQ